MTTAQTYRSHTGAWLVRGDGPSRRYSTKALAARVASHRATHGGLSDEQANKFMRDGDWYTAKCGRCGASLERGGGARPRKSGRLYTFDRAEMLANGGILRCGSSFVISAMLRKDLEIYQPHFDAECILTPTIQGLWAKYRTQPALHDKKFKRAILVDSTTGAVHERTWGEKFAADIVAADTFVVEIFDGMCGYIGIDIYRWGRPEPGMWVQGQVRPSSKEDTREAWLRSTYADRVYIDQLNAALRPLIGADRKLVADRLGIVVGHDWAWAEKNIRKQLLQAYGVPGLV